MFEFHEATSPKDFAVAANLFREYASQLEVDLDFQNFEWELRQISYVYARPQGCVLLLKNEMEQPAGCLGIRELDKAICELKRMYVKPEYRGLGLGKKILLRSLQIASELGYEKMRLDTMPNMCTAIALYEKMGFYRIPAYRHNPVDGALYMEIEL